jgi:hypothetical protein
MQQNLKIKASPTTRELWPELNLAPLVVFSITLHGMNPEENPGRMVYDQLWGYMKGNVAYVSLNFNFNNRQGMDLYAEHLNKVLDHLENGVLKE